MPSESPVDRILERAGEMAKDMCPTSRRTLTDPPVVRRLVAAVKDRLRPEDRTDDTVADAIIDHMPAVKMSWPGNQVYADHAVREWYRSHPSGGGSPPPEQQGSGQAPVVGGWTCGSAGGSPSPSPAQDGDKDEDKDGNEREQEQDDMDGDPGQDGDGKDEDRDEDGSGKEQEQGQDGDPGREPMPEPYGEGEMPDAFRDLVALMSMGLDVALVGPAGCGKTHMMMRAAEHTGRECTITTAPQMPYDLTGFVDGHGKRVETAFTEAFTEGKVAGVDEADRASEDALIAIHAPIANRTMYLPGLGQTPAAEGFQVVMTMNTYGLGMDEDYNTAHQLDTATRDRLVFLPVDFDPRVDAEMCRGDVKLFRFVQAWRAAAADAEATHAVLSYRTEERLAEISRDPRFGRIRALEIALVKGLPKHTVEDILERMEGDNPWMIALEELVRRMEE